MTYRPIEDYGAVGDMRTAALISSGGSVDWLCLPRFDSPSVFAALLDDARGGRFRLAPRGRFASRQHYLEDTNVLVTTFTSSEAEVAVIDFMTVDAPSPELVRVARCLRGAAHMEIEFAPALDYARGHTTLQPLGAHAVLASSGPQALDLSSSVPLIVLDGTAGASFLLREGEAAAFALQWEGTSPPPLAMEAVEGKLRRAVDFWREVSREWTYRGYWPDLVKRSLLALHLLLYAPSGAMCAALTTSLPEHLGGGRNWDYRYCWLRDSAFAIDLFHRLGHREHTLPFLRWLALAQGEGAPLRPLYPIAYHREAAPMQEEVLDHLEGYAGSRPVRIGNAAADQFQLDVYGELVLALYSYHRQGGQVDDALWALVHSLVEAALARWQEPDSGIWEVRSRPRHFVVSKVMAWAALDRGIRLAEDLRRPADLGRWRAAREAIRQEVLANGWSPQRGTFVQSYGGQALDAALLLLPLVGFLPPDDPRIVSTVEAIRRELGQVFLRRYLPEEAPDGLGEEEGAFLLCSLWLAQALALMGQVREALRIFRRVAALGNGLGLYAEMVDPRTGRFLGNYPQAYTHIALVDTALVLDRVLAAGPRLRAAVAGQE
ncbi:MAG TPA: glycoside hydrolase family 15 protein [Dehalococcoidia bacterium]|nr:glycoside hydrolase family 15 protein [Dehalococcoidia bacterium]